MIDIAGMFFIFNGKDYSAEVFERFHELPENHPSIYEVMRIEDHVPLFIEDYLDRLEQSFNLMGETLYMSRQEIKDGIVRLINLNAHSSGPVKMIFGTGSFNFFLHYLMQPHLPNPEEYITGVKTILMKAVRHNPNIKSWNSELRNKTIEALENEGAYEAILVDESGHITEASRSNVFFIQNDLVVTSPVNKVLPGITRKKVLEICGLSGITVKMEQVNADNLCRFDACFLTGTARKIVPVRLINDVAFQVDNPLMKKISHEFESYVKAYINKNRKNRQT